MEPSLSAERRAARAIKRPPSAGLDLAEVMSHDGSAPRYTSYPPANFFRSSPDPEEWRAAVRGSNAFGPRAVSIYVHVPFCPSRCHFCGCQTEVGRKKSFIDRYFQALCAEMDAALPLLDRERPLAQIHFGGGTPNAVPLAYLRGVLDRLRAHFPRRAGAEVAIECDPSLLRPGHAAELAQMGFNRASVGVQDFSPAVLRQVNRRVPRRPLEEIVAELKGAGFASVNLDLICGLPGQSAEVWAEDMRRLLGIRPDRVACFTYAHMPRIQPHQKHLEGLPAPTAPERLAMGVDIHRRLVAAGYVAVGMDHFALPTDELGQAVQRGELARSFQGYCSRARTGQVYAFGASGISQLEAGFFQNIKDARAYAEAAEAGQAPLERHYLLTPREQALRALIEAIMCRDGFDWREWARPALAGPAAELAMELAAPLLSLEVDGLVARRPDGFALTTRGRWLRRIVASRLDPLLQQAGERTFSRAI